MRVSTINHVSFGCADVRASVRWYGRVFGMAVHAFQDYRGGQTVLRVGDGPSYMALSQLDPKNAGKPPSRLPHFCWGTPDFNIDRIIRALAEMQAPAQAVLREGKTINGINFDDADGFRFRNYRDQHHGLNANQLLNRMGQYFRQRITASAAQFACDAAN